MQQLKCFTVEGGATFKKDIGDAIVEVVNPFLAANPGAEIESVDIEMHGSFHKAVVLVSYEVDGRTVKKSEK